MLEIARLILLGTALLVSLAAAIIPVATMNRTNLKKSLYMTGYGILVANTAILIAVYVAGGDFARFLAAYCLPITLIVVFFALIGVMRCVLSSRPPLHTPGSPPGRSELSYPALQAS